MIPFSTGWLAFVVLWEVTALRQPGTLALVAWGVLFLGVGLFIFAGRFGLDAFIRAQTFYGVTDRRALSLRLVFGPALMSTALGCDVALKMASNGRGTLDFAGGVGRPRGLAAWQWRGNGWTIWLPSLPDHVRFLRTDDVMEAYRLATARA